MEAKVRRPVEGQEGEDVMADTKGHLFEQERDVSAIFDLRVRSTKMEGAWDECQWQSLVKIENHNSGTSFSHFGIRGQCIWLSDVVK